MIIKVPVFVATTANLTAVYANGDNGIGATLTNSGAQAILSIDGQTLTANQRILVKDQTIQFQNGIYVVTSIGSASSNWVLTRANDYDQPIEMVLGSVIMINAGTVNGVTTWKQISNQPITVGTDVLQYEKMVQPGITNIVGTSSQINVSIDNNVATISLKDNTVVPGKAALGIPTGGNADRPISPSVGRVRINDHSN